MSSPTLSTMFSPEASVSPMGRVDSNNGHSSSTFGQVSWSPLRSMWMTVIYVGAILGGYATFQWDALLLCLVATVITLCAGYSVGLHRRLIHHSFQCPKWLECFLVYLGTLTGIDGPFSIIEKHDIKDWAQRQPFCHDYLSHRNSFFRDWFWQTHCRFHLDYPPIFRHDSKTARNGFYQWLQQTWMLQQLPLAIAFYHFGGWSWVFWGIYVRIAVSVTLQWLWDYLTSGDLGEPQWTMGEIRCPNPFYNNPLLGLLSFGECWQSNHRAFPNAARFSLYPRQLDPSWWLIRTLRKIGLVWNIHYPCNAVVFRK